MKLVSVNIEGDKHLDRVLPFVQAENPDVVCVQEILEPTIATFEAALGMRAIYAPMAYDLVTHNTGLVCVALFSKVPLTNERIEYYVGSAEQVTRLEKVKATNPDALHTHVQNAVVMADVTVDGAMFRVATTHGTWTPEGNSTEYQKRDFEALIEILERSKPFVFTGDLNAPRGRESFAMLAERYTDNIPAHYTTSLDLTLHRAKHLQLQLMVDGLFTTPEYEARNVRLVDRVSDHMAIVADIERK